MKGLRLPLSMTAFTAAVLLVYRDSVLGEVLGGFEALTAKGAFALIVASGVEAVRSGSVIAQPGGFAYEIYYRCTGILPAAALSVFILASPGRWQSKLCGLALGVPLVFGVNLIRLTHLFHVGVGSPQLFHLAHRYLWESAMMALVLAFWLGWTFWSSRRADDRLDGLRHHGFRPPSGVLQPGGSFPRVQDDAR